MVDGSNGVASALASLNYHRGPDLLDPGSRFSREARAGKMLAAHPSFLNMSSFSDAASVETEGASLPLRTLVCASLLAGPKLHQGSYCRAGVLI